MPQLPRTGVSIREFARLDGCSHTAVQNAVKTGALKLFLDGSLDPKLAGSAWRTGNYAPVRGGKPRTATRQVANLWQPAPELVAGETSSAMWKRVHGRESDAGYMGGLSNLGGDLPALAAEIASATG